MSSTGKEQGEGWPASQSQLLPSSRKHSPPHYNSSDCPPQQFFNCITVLSYSARKCLLCHNYLLLDMLIINTSCSTHTPPSPFGTSLKFTPLLLSVVENCCFHLYTAIRELIYISVMLIFHSYLHPTVLFPFYCRHRRFHGPLGCHEVSLGYHYRWFLLSRICRLVLLAPKLFFQVYSPFLLEVVCGDGVNLNNTLHKKKANTLWC